MGVTDSKNATTTTTQINRETAARYDMADRQDFADAERGIVAPFPGPVTGADRHVIFGIDRLAWITDEAAVHRVDGLSQVRNYDIGDLIATSRPTVSYLSPAVPITRTGEKREIAGLAFEFHDQALRMANQGNTPLEAAELVQPPDSLGRKWFNRGDHGTRHHDERAVCTKELGRWDGDPVSPHPQPNGRRGPPVRRDDRGRSHSRGGSAGDRGGDDRWAAEIRHKLVFADRAGARPETTAARELPADADEQMGYQAEGPQWRGICPPAAKELRDGIRPAPSPARTPSWPRRSTSCSTSSRCTWPDQFDPNSPIVTP